MTSSAYLTEDGNVSLQRNIGILLSRAVVFLFSAVLDNFLWPHISDVLVYLGHGRTLAMPKTRSLTDCFGHRTLTLCVLILSSPWFKDSPSYSLRMRMSPERMCCWVKKSFKHTLWVERSFPGQRRAWGMLGITFLWIRNPGMKKDPC